MTTTTGAVTESARLDAVRRYDVLDTPPDGAFDRVTALDAARVVDVELVVAELIGNALRHAPGTIELILEAHADRVVLHVIDKGPGFAFSPRLPSDLYSEAGRGLFLIASFSTDFTVERRAGGGSHARITFSTREGDSSS